MVTSWTWLKGPYDLRRAFLAGVLLPLAGLSASVVLFMVSWAERSLEARLQGEIELLSRAVTPGISAQLDRGNTAEIGRRLDALFTIQRVYGAAVYDEDGDLVVSAGTADREIRSSDAASDVVRTGEERGRYRNVAGEHVYAHFSPLFDYGGRISGLLQVTRDRREMDAAVAQVRGVAWSLWLVGVVGAIVVTLVLYRRLVGRHVQAILLRMQAIGTGDRDVYFEATSPREFAEIGAGFNAMVRSIREAEEELRHGQSRERDLERKLRQSERVAIVGRVAQGLAHELGSPLSVIDGRLRRLEAHQEGDRAGRALPDIRRQLRRMTDIVRQLLSYGRADTIRREAVSLNALIASACEDVDGSRVATRVEPGSVTGIVHGDPVRLELAVSNLIRNAVRHARCLVQVGVHPAPDGGVELFVEDDGPGVADEDVPQLFEPFFTRQPSGQGTGLGLAIVASVMHEHGGSARCERSGLGGARFALWFPTEVVA